MLRYPLACLATLTAGTERAGSEEARNKHTFLTVGGGEAELRVSVGMMRERAIAGMNEEGGIPPPPHRPCSSNVLVCYRWEQITLTIPHPSIPTTITTTLRPSLQYRLLGVHYIGSSLSRCLGLQMPVSNTHR